MRQQSPNTSQVILAYTRDDMRALNQLARARMRAAGALHGPTRRCRRSRASGRFAGGDRIMFLRNERGLGGVGGSGRSGPEARDGVAVKNGTLGTVLAVEAGGERLTVRLDGPGGPGAPGQVAGRTVTFSVRDYGHLEHGYAATLHKAQGVTVDRAHVLASRPMDRHAAYVGLSRHRDGVVLHYGRDQFADAAALARVLGRQRSKDTSLDYPGGRVPDPEGQARDPQEALVRRYAERRGLDPLRPESEIVVAACAAEPPEPAPTPAPRRSKFAGLKLRAEERPAPEGSQVRAEPAVPQAATPRQADTPEARLERSLGAYARAWSDAQRMQEAGLPVLPHQVQTLERAGNVIDDLTPQLAQDTRAVLERTPGLARCAHGVGSKQAGGGGRRRAGGAAGTGRARSGNGAGLGRARTGLHGGSEGA